MASATALTAVGAVILESEIVTGIATEPPAVSTPTPASPPPMSSTTLLCSEPPGVAIRTPIGSADWASFASEATRTLLTTSARIPVSAVALALAGMRTVRLDTAEPFPTASGASSEDGGGDGPRRRRQHRRRALPDDFDPAAVPSREVVEGALEATGADHHAVGGRRGLGRIERFLDRRRRGFAAEAGKADAGRRGRRAARGEREREQDGGHAQQPARASALCPLHSPAHLASECSAGFRHR